MNVTVSFFGPMKRPWRQNTRNIEVDDGISVHALLQSFGYAEEDMQRVSVVVNGERRKLSAGLRAGDEVTFVLMAGGG